MVRQPDGPAMDVFLQDIRKTGIDPGPDWPALAAQFTEVAYDRKSTIFSQAQVADRVLFVASGIVASEQVHLDGTPAIARFFERGQFATNVTSAWRRELAEDTLIAITDVQGVTMPVRFFTREYMDGGAFGQYLRRKVLETIFFDKEVICAKTLTETEARYRFLKDQHRDVLDLVPAKDVARFLGIAPQSLSRFLRKRRPG